jgi:dephospho-CoA kinase
MLKVALTGGIATGKSYCLARFAALGVPVIDADRLAREAVEPGAPALDAIRGRFGPEVLSPSGALDRQRLGAIVFQDARARRDLEAILHPEVYRRIKAWSLEIAAAGRHPLAMADIPLLFETGHDREFDRVVVVACTPARQIERMQTRNGLSAEDARRRLGAQWPIARKIELASYVIMTDGTFEDTDTQVDQVHRALVWEAEELGIEN